MGVGWWRSSINHTFFAFVSCCRFKFYIFSSVRKKTSFLMGSEAMRKVKVELLRFPIRLLSRGGGGSGGPQAGWFSFMPCFYLNQRFEFETNNVLKLFYPLLLFQSNLVRPLHSTTQVTQRG